MTNAGLLPMFVREAWQKGKLIEKVEKRLEQEIEEEILFTIHGKLIEGILPNDNWL